MINWGKLEAWQGGTTKDTAKLDMVAHWVVFRLNSLASIQNKNNDNSKY